MDENHPAEALSSDSPVGNTTGEEESFEEMSTRLTHLLEAYTVESKKNNLPLPNLAPRSGNTEGSSPMVTNDNKVLQCRLDLLSACEKMVAVLTEPLLGLRGLSDMHVTTAALQVIIDLDIAKSVPLDGNSDISLAQLAEQRGIEPTLLRRLMRLLTAQYIFRETAPQRYAHTSLSLPLRDGSIADLISIGLIEGLRSSSRAAETWKANNYANPDDNTNLPFQKAYDTKKHYFDYIFSDPESGRRFNSAMEGSTRASINNTAMLYLFGPILDNNPMSSPPKVIVDVGGGKGQVLVGLRRMYPDSNVRYVLQDFMVTEAYKEEGIEYQVHDFFQPQVEKGADVYILRRILHDWPDKDCIRIIRGIVDAMTPNKSKLLICDRIVPEINAPLPIVVMDIRMATILGGMERTKQQWNALFAAADSRLVLRKVFTEERFHESVLELEIEQ